MKYKCTECGVEYKRKPSAKGLFCSIQCQHNFKFKQRYTNWALGIENPICKTYGSFLRRALIFKDGNQCSVCKITKWNNKHITFEVEHINGNAEDHSVNNVCLICPNCHSQTSTYKAKNKGNGRTWRNKGRVMKLVNMLPLEGKF